MNDTRPPVTRASPDAHEYRMALGTSAAMLDDMLLDLGTPRRLREGYMSRIYEACCCLDGQGVDMDDVERRMRGAPVELLRRRRLPIRNDVRGLHMIDILPGD